MESYYIILVGILILLAVSDLIVGVSNDAVNFLNSAIGAKAFSIRKIMLVASIGVFAGAVSSSGMMEIARKGIFAPGMFQFDEIMILFMAVMLTDILLLDLFNSLGLPTSTTVSIVFELLGAAVAMAIIKINSTDGIYLEDLGNYIQSGRALLIIAGIFISVAVAFTVGAIVQYISRIIFTFQFEKQVPYVGSIFGGFAITSILYFIFIKGIKGSVFYESIHHILDNYLIWVLLGCFVVCTLISQILYWLFRFNVLRFTVLIGTFALAMAFAGNDLVNFIGVPIAAYQSYEQWAASGVAPSDFSMAGLAAKVATPQIFLIAAGSIMVLTLWFNKKARAVIATGVNLSRQGEGQERFHSNAFARGIVRFSLTVARFFDYAMPNSLSDSIERRFEQTDDHYLTQKEKQDKPAFDLVRASVNLVVAGVLISIGTSYKLPLSTTYVTFMVAMGTSLADRAWNRESAVYRIAGVVNVIGGWFLTAIVAFTASALIAFLISRGWKWGGDLGLFIAVVILALIAASVLIYNTFFKKEVAIEEADIEDTDDLIDDKVEFVEKSTRNVTIVLKNIADIYNRTIKALEKVDPKQLKKIEEKTNKVDTKSKKIRDNVHFVIHDLQVVSLETGNHYVQSADYLREIGKSITHIVRPVREYVANNHKPFSENQISDLRELSAMISELYEDVNTVSQHIPEVISDEEVEIIQERQKAILSYISQIRKKQIKRIKSNAVGTRNSLLFLSIITETKSLVLYTGSIVKSLRDFSKATSEQLDLD